uniref:Putative ribonuclease H-like domain-containing protein n=1 Tax=Tanacetum cinerariifolium TaxID=118510 RepID=A0A6L2J433_TANCI|nr:putative ribonuclease H-like domain-containing protein [Tanacetum cinerariifolium]
MLLLEGTPKEGKSQEKAEAVNTACYVPNRVLVVKPHNKTPYELFHGRTSTLSFMRPFGCPVTILNTIDHLGKFNGKADEGSGPNWLFDIDALTRTMNYEPIIACTQSNGFAGTKASDNAGQARKETKPVKDYILLPLWTVDLPLSYDLKSSHDDGSKLSCDDRKKVDEDPRKESECKDQDKEDNVNNTNNTNTVDVSIFNFSSDDEDDGTVAHMNNLDTTIQVSLIPTTRIHKDHPLDQKKDGIFISQDKYVDEILKKFTVTEVKTTSTSMETQKTLLKDEDGEEVDVHMYRSMIGSLMYLTSSRPDIMFVVYACARYQVNPKVSHLHVVKRLFRHLKSQPKLDLWKPTRKDTQIPQPSGPTESVIDKVVHKELGDRLVRAATTASSLKANQDSGNTLQSDEDSMKLDELMALCTTLQNRALDLEKTTTTQCNEVNSLKRKVKKLEKRNRSRTHKLKRLYRVGLSARVESFGDEESLGEDASKHGRRIDVIDANKDITLVNDVDKEMFDVDDLGGEEVFVAGQNENIVEEVVNVAQVSIVATTVTITTEEITLAQALEALKTLKPKVKRIVFQDPGKFTTKTISSNQSRDKGKGIMIEEHVKPKKKDQIKLDEEAAKKLQAEFDEEERLGREKPDKEKRLAERLPIQEQEELSDAEKATLFQQLLEKKRKHFAAKIAEEKRKKPPTKAQQRKIMCTYLKNIEGYKLKDLKLKEFDSIKEMFDKAFKRVNTFEDFRTELVEGKEKRARTELEQEITKKQKIYKEGKKSYYQIVRADRKSQMYMIFSQMLKSFEKEDLEDLYKLVKARYGSTRPVENMDYLLWSNMKIMFVPHVEDKVWKLQKGYKVLEWKMYDSCGVHSLMMQSMQIYMLVKKKYHLTPPTLSMML